MQCAIRRPAVCRSRCSPRTLRCEFGAPLMENVSSVWVEHTELESLSDALIERRHVTPQRSPYVEESGR
jgi:hypothetical protein